MFKKWTWHRQTKKTEISGILEIDHDRGVIYFHTDDKQAMEEYGSQTILRLCRLPLPMPERAMDVTHMHGCDWGPAPPDTIQA